MEIRVKLYAAIKKYGPEGQHKFNLEIDSSHGAEVALKNVLKKLDIPDSIKFNVLINGRYRHGDTLLKNGDALVIFPLLDGG